MSNKERIAELEDIIRVMNPKSTAKYRAELGLLKAAEAEAPKKPDPVVESPKPKKTKKTKKS